MYGDLVQENRDLTNQLGTIYATAFSKGPLKGFLMNVTPTLRITF